MINTSFIRNKLSSDKWTPISDLEIWDSKPKMILSFLLEIQCNLPVLSPENDALDNSPQS